VVRKGARWRSKNTRARWSMPRSCMRAKSTRCFALLEKWLLSNPIVGVLEGLGAAVVEGPRFRLGEPPSTAVAPRKPATPRALERPASFLERAVQAREPDLDGPGFR